PPTAIAIICHKATVSRIIVLNVIVFMKMDSGMESGFRKKMREELNSKIRMTKSERSPKSEARGEGQSWASLGERPLGRAAPGKPGSTRTQKSRPGGIQNSSFGIISSFAIRISDLELRLQVIFCSRRCAS